MAHTNIRIHKFEEIFDEATLVIGRVVAVLVAHGEGRLACQYLNATDGETRRTRAMATAERFIEWAPSEEDAPLMRERNIEAHSTETTWAEKMEPLMYL